ncbi:CP family cyanate transporter-like MFS transporter [Oikeobacillus pervagus]|uniref:CP family cyanate transporter-like MFS transporter n=1 Tax=Oikeobacillus pervagus TaxID=1325931 RepID=A0AAJ1SZY3_9BACI|nr:MFS transporter [Oikeobacillus pervagus]MDQ0214372.1 CP family cyanate transporter-like MFS transporter [Oikeobacillus pervagus]
MGGNATVLENTNSSNQKSLFLLMGIILIGANLRAPLTSVGPLIPNIRNDLEISNAIAGTITTLPLLAFAFFSPFAPKIANRFGMERTIFYSLTLLTIGIFIRSFPGTISLFTGTVLIGLSIAFGNVLLPGFIKLKYPLRIGVVTGIYAVFMNLFGAIASGVSVPLTAFKSLGWQGALSSWGILSFIAMVIWLPQLLSKSNNQTDLTSSPQHKSKNIWRSALAWKITLFMGLQSLIFYTLMTWLPEILHLHHYSSSSAGWMLFLMQFAIIPITFIVPVIAGKMKNQILLSAVTALFFIVGIVGLIAGNPILIPFWVVIIGIGSGSAFSLSMMFFSLRTTDGQQASELSGMAQSFGYLLAAVGPVLFGGLHDAMDSWTVPLTMLLGISIIILMVGIGAGKDKIIS